MASSPQRTHDMIVLQVAAVRCSALQSVAMCCNVLQRVAVCCSVLFHKKDMTADVLHAIKQQNSDIFLLRSKFTDLQFLMYLLNRHR